MSTSRDNMDKVGTGSFQQRTLPWGLCWLLSVATALSFLDRQVLSILSPQIIAELRMDSVSYSYVVAAFQVSYTVMFTLGGRFVDRVGTGLGLGVAITVWSLASGAHALVGGWVGLAIARFCLGFGEGACFPGATKGAVEWFPARMRVLAIGIANCGSAFGAVVAPPMTATLNGYLGWRGVFVGTAVIGLVWVVVWTWAVHRYHDSPEVRSSAASDVNSQTPVRSLLRDRRVWSVLATRFMFDPVIYFVMFWVPLYLAHDRGMSVSDIGGWFWIPFLALGIGNIVSGKITDVVVHSGLPPIRARAFIMMSVAAASVVCWFVPLVRTSGAAIALMSFLLFSHGLWITNFLGLIGDNFRAGDVATVTGLSGTAGGTASVLSSVVIGVVAERGSYAPVFVVMGMLYPIAALILLRTHWQIGGAVLGAGRKQASSQS